MEEKDVLKEVENKTEELKTNVTNLGNEASELAKKTLDEAKTKGADLLNDAKEKVDSLKKDLLGEDGKLGQDDLAKLGDKVKESGVGKAILGEDGKFDKEDVDRIVGNAKDAAEKAVNSVKELLGKKE